MADDDGGWLAADLAEVRGAGSAMLALGDAVGALGGSQLLAGRDAYGSGALGAAAARFADRYGHLVRSVGGALCDAGEVLRETADEYADVDILAPITQLERGQAAPPGGPLA